MPHVIIIMNYGDKGMNYGDKGSELLVYCIFVLKKNIIEVTPYD